MFRRNNPVSGLQSSDAPAAQSMSELPLRPSAQPAASPAQMTAPTAAPAVQPLAARPLAAAPMPTQMAAAPAPMASKPADLPNSRFGGIPGVMPRRVGGAEGQTGHNHSEQAGLRKLIVGREISMSGDITACDILMVEGNIEATLRDGKVLEITSEGYFKGSAEVDEADIAGKFEGSLTVRGRLKLRSTGHIEGTLSYGEIEVEAGGRLVGELKLLPASAQKRSEGVATAKIAVGGEG